MTVTYDIEGNSPEHDYEISKTHQLGNYHTCAIYFSLVKLGACSKFLQSKGKTILTADNFQNHKKNNSHFLIHLFLGRWYSTWSWVTLKRLSMKTVQLLWMVFCSVIVYIIQNSSICTVSQILSRSILYSTSNSVTNWQIRSLFHTSSCYTQYTLNFL